MIKRLRDFVRRLRGDPAYFDTTGRTFRPFDPEEIAKRLRLEEKGQRQGSREQPHASATQLDGPQQEALRHVDWIVTRTLSDAQSAYSGLTARVRQARPQADLNQLVGLAQRQAHELDLLLDEHRPLISQAREDFTAADAEYAAFRSANGISRSPAIPESRFVLWASLVVSTVGEGVVNAVFFQRGSSLGLAGGALTAFLFALIDVICVFGLGRAAPWFVARQWYYKAASAIACTIFVLWAGTYNLVVAHIREQLQRVPDGAEAAQLALESFRVNPFGLSQLDSWILFALGVVFSVLAFGSGTRWDDPYPGHGRRARRRQLMMEEYQFALRRLRALAEEVHRGVADRLEQLALSGRQKLEVLEHTIATKRGLRHRAQLFVDRLPGNCEALLQIYRDANRAARSADAPAYFDRVLDHEWPQAIPDDEEDDQAILADARREWGTADKKLAKVRTSIEREFREFLRQLEQLDPLGVLSQGENGEVAT